MIIYFLFVSRLKEVFGDSDRPMTVEDLPRLKYLEAVVRESIRLYPPVPLIVRKVTSDLKLRKLTNENLKRQT